MGSTNILKSIDIEHIHAHRTLSGLKSKIMNKEATRGVGNPSDEH
jgi:hypothetical protein